jgi:dihydroorotase
VSPISGRDGPGAVAVRAGRIAAVFDGPAADAAGRAREVLDFPNCVLLPGLIDLHVHAGTGPWQYGVDPDAHLLARGTTTALSQGDAGAANWPQYRDEVIARSRTRLRMALNLAACGETRPGGCLEDAAGIDIDACVRTVEAGGDEIWGIAVNISPMSCGATDPRRVLDAALLVAERTGRPLLFGPRRGTGDFDLAEQLPRLRPGDVVTYCFHGLEQSIVADGRVRDCVWRARERGVLFDVGHGRGSFDFRVAEAAIAAGFAPDTISTDMQARHVGQSPPHDLPRVLSMLLAVGMRGADAFAAVTSRPAAILGLARECGTLATGACADLTVLRWNDAAPPLADTQGATRPGGSYEAVCIVREGVVVGVPPSGG